MSARTQAAAALDAVDRALLRELQIDNRRPIRTLAAAVGVSAATCLRRLRRLSKLRMFRAHASLLDPARAGFGVRVCIEVRLVDASGDAMRAFEQRIAGCREVQQLFELAGDVDYLLVLQVREAAEVATFARRELADSTLVRSYTTRWVLGCCKDEHALPVADAP